MLSPLYHTPSDIGMHWLNMHTLYLHLSASHREGTLNITNTLEKILEMSVGR